MSEQVEPDFIKAKRAELAAIEETIAKLQGVIGEYEAWVSNTEAAKRMQSMSDRALVRHLLVERESWSAAEMTKEVLAKKSTANAANVPPELTNCKNDGLADFRDGRYYPKDQSAAPTAAPPAPQNPVAQQPQPQPPQGGTQAA